jgi:hypothetical protein
MSAPFKDDSYRLPNFGRDGVERDILKGWNPPVYPSLPPTNVIPEVPVIPGFPWWVDPRMLPTPRLWVPGDPPRRDPLAPPSPSSSLGRSFSGGAGGLLGLLQEGVLEDESQQRAGALGAPNAWQRAWETMASWR